MENNINVKIESWRCIYKRLPINNNNKNFIKLLNKSFLSLSEDKQYVYLANYKFGKKIINEGNAPKDYFSLTNIINPFSKDNSNLINDLDYSRDPLGIIIKNEAVIVSNSDKTRLGLLEEGQLLGVFGTLDYLNFEKSDVVGKQDWNVYSGDSSFHFIFSFLLSANDLVKKRFLKSFFRTKNDTNKSLIKEDGKYVYDKRKSLIQKNISLIEELGIETSNTEIVYLPKHIFNQIQPNTLQNQLLNLNVRYFLYQKGWEQSKEIRDYLFEDGVINDEIKNIEDLYNKETLLELYALCYHISKGEKDVLMTLTNEDIKEKQYFRSFKALNEGHFDSNNPDYPLILKHKKLKSKNDIGVISLNHLPFKNTTVFKDLKQTIDGINEIKKVLNHNFELMFYQNKKGRQGYYGVHSNFINYLISSKKLKKFNIPNEEYDKLVLVKSSLENTFPEYYVLNELKKSNKDLKNDFENYYIISVQHILRSTGSLFEALINIGFNPNNIYLTGKIYSTHKETKELLEKDSGINLIDSTIKEDLGQYSQGLKEDIDKMWNLLLTKIGNTQSKIIILDDGGHILKSVNKDLLSKPNIEIFGIEQTTSGIRDSKKFENFPIIDVAGSAAKVLIEPNLVSEAVNIQLHDHFINFQKNKIGIIGYGHIGKAIAQEYEEKGYQIFVFDNKKKIKESNTNITVCENSWELYLNSEIIIGATGDDITDNRWITQSNEDKIFMSVSSGDIEFNKLIQNSRFRDLNSEENLKKPIPLRIKELNTDKGHKLIILRGGMVSNFTGSADSSPGKYIQITRGLLFSAIIQILKNGNNLKKEVLKLDAKLQKKVVEDWFKDQPQKRNEYSSEVLSVFEKINLINKKSGGTL